MSVVHLVTHGKIHSNVATLTLDAVDGLAVGALIDVTAPAPFNAGTVTVTGVDTTKLEVTFALVHANTGLTDLVGQVLIVPEWIVDTDVIAFLGFTPSSTEDVDWLDTCVAAGNAWAFGRRQAAGYVDFPQTVPSPAVKTGTTLYAAALYRERGSVDSFQSFDGMPVQPQFGSLGQVMRLLGLQKPGVG